MTLEREVGRVVTAKMVAERRIKLALKRIATFATMDNPDEMGACISDVEQLLRGKPLQRMP